MAMKKMKKSEMIAKHQINHVKAEKEVLANAHNQWIVELKYSFHVVINEIYRMNDISIWSWNIYPEVIS